MRRFCGLRSLWRTFRLWQNARPFNSWYMNDCTWEREKASIQRVHQDHIKLLTDNQYGLEWLKAVLIPVNHLETKLIFYIDSLSAKMSNVSPSQFQDLDPHCSCQNTSSNPTVHKRHISLKYTWYNIHYIWDCLSPDRNIQKPRLTSCHCATHRVVCRRQNSFKLTVLTSGLNAYTHLTNSETLSVTNTTSWAHQTDLTMFLCFSSFSRQISLRAELGTPWKKWHPVWLALAC